MQYHDDGHDQRRDMDKVIGDLEDDCVGDIDASSVT